MTTTRRELWFIGILLLLFLIITTFSRERGQELRPTNEPSTFNAQRAGTKALYLLLEAQGISTMRQRTSWMQLPPQAGLLCVIEPLANDRRITRPELRAMKSWIEQGGTLFYMASLPERGLDKDDPLAGDVEIVRGDSKPTNITVNEADSPYLKGVSNIASLSRVRLNGDEHYHVLLQDDQGALLLEKPMGRGHLLLCAIENLISNATLTSETHDNALLFLQIARQSLSSSRSTVAFDEYHHGVGFEMAPLQENTTSLWHNTPLPLRLLTLHLLLVFVLLLWNANRRFGAIVPLPSLSYRPSIDYLEALGRFWRRTHSSDVAFLNHYEHLLSGLHIKYGTSAEDSTLLFQEMKRTTPEFFGRWQNLFQRAEQIRAGERLLESEMILLTKQLENLWKEVSLVG